MTVSGAIKQFLDSLIGYCSPATIVWYTRRLSSLQELGRAPVDRITADQLQLIYKKLSQRTERWRKHPSGRAASAGGLSPFTLHSYIRAWRRLFAYLVEREHITRNPAKLIRLPLLPNQPPKAITEADMKRMMLHVNNEPRDYAVMCVLVDTGCRVGGVASLTLDNVDLRRARATIFEKGRGGKKSRTVFFSQRTVKALRCYLRQRPECDHQFVFVSARCDPLSEGAIAQMLGRTAEHCGVRGRSNPHSFRHGAARAMLNNGADIEIVSDLLGHSDISVTKFFYGRWSVSELQAKHKKVSWMKTS
jgi:site-specific recombinase XerD